MMMEEEVDVLWSHLDATIYGIFDSYLQRDELMMESPATLSPPSPVLTALVAAAIVPPPYPDPTTYSTKFHHQSTSVGPPPPDQRTAALTNNISDFIPLHHRSSTAPSTAVACTASSSANEHKFDSPHHNLPDVTAERDQKQKEKCTVLQFDLAATAVASTTTAPMGLHTSANMSWYSQRQIPTAFSMMKIIAPLVASHDSDEHFFFFCSAGKESQHVCDEHFEKATTPYFVEGDNDEWEIGLAALIEPVYLMKDAGPLHEVCQSEQNEFPGPFTLSSYNGASHVKELFGPDNN
ncbi:hypothetical protein OROHE_006656 [Orobanche hederae]